MCNLSALRAVYYMFFSSCSIFASLGLLIRNSLHSLHETSDGSLWISASRTLLYTYMRRHWASSDLGSRNVRVSNLCSWSGLHSYILLATYWLFSIKHSQFQSLHECQDPKTPKFRFIDDTTWFGTGPTLRETCVLRKMESTGEEKDFTFEHKWSLVVSSLFWITYIISDWPYSDLNDFKCESNFTYFSYSVLWYNLFISITSYLIDLYILLNLMFFNKWASLQPCIPFDIACWVFLIGVLLSWANLVRENRRASRIIEQDGVVESYLDNLAFRLQSLRYGEGHGWKRFLVFAKITSYKKAADTIALFTQFGFQSTWPISSIFFLVAKFLIVQGRVLLCFLPLQIINVSTLHSAFTSTLQADYTSEIFSNMELL